MKLMKQLLNDEAGFIVSSELVLVATIVVIGMIVGLTTARDQVVQELGDVAIAIGALSQSYQFNSVIGHSSATSGSLFQDLADWCDGGGVDNEAEPPACIAMTSAGTANESEDAPEPSNGAGG